LLLLMMKVRSIRRQHASSRGLRVVAMRSSDGPVHLTDDATASNNDDGDAEEEEEDLWSKREHLRVTPDLLPPELARRLRETFDSRFRDPRQGGAERFVWDYWNVPDQYNLLRTPAKRYFSDQDYRGLEDALLGYGQRELGCSRMTPLWLSCYVDGCYQGFHADNPHGPWAFVLSLTEEGHAFEGGETTIMKPRILEYWRTYDPAKGCESGDIFDKVSPDFNKLIVFDPRLPHGVSAVRGSQDPREGRLVLHGWFADPRPFFDGALDADAVQEPLAECMESISAELQQMPPATGMLAIRLHVLKDGSVESIDWLSDTLVPIPGAPVLALDGASVEPPEDARQLILEVIVEGIANLSFPKSSGDTEVTLPFVFE